MSKGEVTRQAILEHATHLASRVGLEALSIGKLAEDLELSKSGLFAHFKSKEALQVQVLEHAGARFADSVVRPGLKAPRGEPRLRELFRRWRAWPEEAGLPGGCLMVAVAAELDDRPGPARDVYVRLQRDWIDVLANVTRTAVAEGHFKKSVDPEQFAYELWGVLLALHFYTRLLKDPRAGEHADAAFEALVARARA
jgi:AcrR family transcriptional regulator